MRVTLFLICFSAGVSLMILSGYVPRRASAEDGGRQAGSAGGRQAQPAATPRVGRFRLASPGGGELGAPVLTTELLGTTPADSSEDESADDGDPAEAVDPATPSKDGGQVDGEHAGGSIVAGAHDAVSTPDPEDSVRDDDASRDQPQADAADRGDSGAAADGEPPVADAGPDRTVWAGWGDIVLDGSNSDGDGLEFEWRLAGEPRLYELVDADFAIARALLRADAAPHWGTQNLTFELTVRDEQGRVSRDSVSIAAVGAPELSVSPGAQRRFVQRDGLWLGHYECALGSAEGAAVLSVSADVPLTFSAAGAFAYELVELESGSRTHSYELVIYREVDAADLTAEFLLDSADGVPCVLRAVVLWGGR